MSGYTVEIPEPRFARFFFSNARVAWLWLPIRLYVGYEWLMAGWNKVTSPLWTGANAGKPLLDFFTGVLSKTGGAHPNVSDWYAFFIQHVAVPHTVLFANLVSYGELLVGIGLILGAFTGIAAFFGAFMNLNYLFSGTVSVNPLLLLLEIFLILAWRNAGWIGLDRWLLPRLGVPWQPGKAWVRSSPD